ncbi:MAG: hypothetical protein LBG15_05175 [Dysgonamonadaceae bacterium]|jgi:hypothetical protein|nr:hypothetical protein [Dysgonamonadaceae bacterium]
MNTILKYIYGAALLIVCISPSIQAQTDNPDLQRELNLEKEYSPTLRDVHKINQLPEIKAPEAPETKVTFSNYTPDYTIPSYYRQLTAKTYFPDFATGNKKGYLDWGISSSINIDADLGYQILNSAEDRLSIFGSHRSSNSNVTYLQKNGSGDEKQKMKFNDNLAGINYLHHLGTAKLLADAQYTHSAFNYYGLPVFSTESAARNNYAGENQKNNLFQTHIGIESVDKEEISYKANLIYTLFKQKYGETKAIAGRTENRIMADFDLFAKFIGIAGSIKNYSYRVPEKTGDKSDYATFSFNPYLIFGDEDRNIRLGIKANLQAGEIKKFMIAPDIHFNWRSPKNLLFYLSAKGGIKDNSNYDLYYENRYVDPLCRIYDSKSPFDGTAGVRFSPLPNLGIDLFTGYKWVRDEHFFYSKRSLSVPQYAHAQIFKIGGAVKYACYDIFDLGLKLIYQKWNVSELSNIIAHEEPPYKLEAWNKPAFTGDLNIGLNVSTIPFRIDLTYHLEAGRKALFDFNETNRMKNIHDLNVKGNYAINDAFSVFVKINNLFFQKYDLWYGYPAQNFNIMGGIRFKF